MESNRLARPFSSGDLLRDQILHPKTYPKAVWNGLNGAAKAVQNISNSRFFSGRFQLLLNLTVSE